MKKLSLATLVALSTALTANAVKAENYVAAPSGVAVTIGGFADFQIGLNSFDRYSDNNEVKFQNDTEIHFGIEATTEGGSVYGAVIELEADVSGDGDNDGVNADKTFLYFENDSGRYELGNVDGAEARLKVDAGTVSRGTGGVAGDFYDYITDANSAYLSDPLGIIVTPDLPSAYVHESGQNNEEEATKLSYYSPNYEGLQFGLSYTPESANSGQNVAGTANGISQEDLFSVGLSYERVLDANEGMNVYASLTGEFGSGVGTNEDRSAYAVGLGMDWKGFSIAGSYGDLGDLSATKSGDYFDIAVAYSIAGFNTSLGYLSSEVSDSTNAAGKEFSNISLSVDYALYDGVTPYFEVNFIDIDAQDATLVANKDGDGIIVLGGVELAF